MLQTVPPEDMGTSTRELDPSVRYFVLDEYDTCSFEARFGTQTDAMRRRRTGPEG